MILLTVKEIYLIKDVLERILPNVSKPSQYVGGEIGSITKDKNKVDVQF